MASSLEHGAVTKCATELTTVISTDPLSTSNKLLTKGIISRDSHEKIAAESHGEPQAKQLVSCIEDHIREKPSLFQSLLQFLEQEPCFQDIAARLKESLSQGNVDLDVPNPQNSQWPSSVADIDKRFNILVSTTLTSLVASQVTPIALTNSLLTLKMFDSVSEEPLLLHHKHALEEASSIAVIFKIVEPYMSFLNPGVLAHIIEYLGTDCDRKNFKDFINILEVFCTQIDHETVFHHQPDETPVSEQHTAFQKVHIVVKTPQSLAKMNLKGVQDFRSKVANIFKLNATALQIKPVSESPVTLSFLFPNVSERLFPLLNDQEQDFRSLGVVAVKSGAYSCTIDQRLVTQPVDSEVSDEADKEIELPSLGRPFGLGMFYDCRNDNIIRGMKLCNEDVLEAATEEEPTHDSFIGSVIPEDTIGMKAQYLGLTTGLQLSLMTGLVKDISGSARYWDNRLTSKHKIRVCLMFGSTNCTKYLPVEELSNLHEYLPGCATHVVSKIVYGLDAYFVIDHPVYKGEKHKDVQDTIAKMLSKQGLGDTKSAIAEPDGSDGFAEGNTECEVFSDVELSNQPLSLHACIKTFRNLMQADSSATDHLFPKRVWLYPLKRLDNRYNAVVRPVRSDMVAQLQSLFEDLHDLHSQANDILSFQESITSKFKYLHDRLAVFTEEIKKHQLNTSKCIGKLLPLVREGKIAEAELVKVIEEATSSPFHHPDLTTWLEQKDREASELSSVLKKLEGVDFVSPTELPSLCDDSGSTTVCFAINVGFGEDPVLDKLKLYNEEGLERRSSSIPPSTAWYNNSDLMEKVTSQAERFKEFHTANHGRKNARFVITSDIIHANDSSVSSPGRILLYKGTPEAWEPPGPPRQPVATVLSHDSVQLKWSKPEYGSQNVECYTITYRSSDNTSWQKWTTNSAEESETLNKFDTKGEYVFKIQAVCTHGFALSKESDLSNSVVVPYKSSFGPGAVTIVVKTLTDDFCRPGKPKVSSTTHNSIQLEWATPECGSKFVDRYSVFYSSTDGRPWKRELSKDTKVCITELAEQTNYKFKVRAELCGGDVGAESEVSDVVTTQPQSELVTNRCRPGKPKSTKITHNNVTLTWDKPEENRESVQLYIVSYRPLDDPESDWNCGTQSSETCITIGGLSANVRYIFKVRPECKSGPAIESEPSDPIKTKPVCQPGKPRSVYETEKSIFVEWEKPNYGHDNVDRYIVTYRLMQGSTTTDMKQESSKNSCLVTGLHPKSLYSFRVSPVARVESDHGTLDSQWSSLVQTRATSPPTNVSASSITHNSIHLKWSKPKYVSEDVEKYAVSYCISKLNAQSEAEWKTETTKKLSVTIRDLSPATKYSFTVQPLCKLGWKGTECKLVDPIGTKATSPPGKPVVAASESAITHDSILLQWNAPLYGTEHVKCYVLTYHTESKPVANALMKFTKSQETSMTVSGLTPKVKYVFSVHSECEIGVGAKSEQSESILTKASSPSGKPVILEDGTTHRSVDLSWSKPTFGSQNVKWYEVYAKKITGGHYRNIFKTANAAQTKCKVKPLDPFTKYVFKIRPVADGGFGCFSEESDPVTTRPTSAPKRVQINEKKITHNSIVLSWNKPDKCSQTIKYYTILYRQASKTSGKWEECQTTFSATQGSEASCTYKVSGLSADTEYAFKVRPECNASSGTESKSIENVKTKPVCECGKPQATTVSYSSITWKWSKPAMPYHIDNVQSYSVWLKASHDSNWKHATVTKHPTCSLNDLLANTTYILRIQPQMLPGMGTIYCEYSESDPISTKPTSPPGKPKVTEVTFKSIRLDWTKPKCGSDFVNSYVVKCYESPHMILFRNVTTTTCSETQLQETVTIDSLHPGFKYTFRVQPKCDMDCGMESDFSDPIQTKPTSQPGRPTAGTITHNSIQLIWTAPVHGCENIECYTVLCPMHNVAPTVSSHDCYSVTIQNLMPKTKYAFRVQPNCKRGMGDGTDSEQSDIIETKPVCQPGKPTATTVTHNSIRVTWSKPDYGSDEIAYYNVTHWHNDESKQFATHVTTIGAQRDVNLNELSINKAYYVEVTPKRHSSEGIACVPSTSDPIKTKATSEPGKPTAFHKTHDSIQLKWTKPVQGSKNVGYYVVKYCPANDTEKKWEKCPGPKLLARECDKPTQRLLIDRLDPNSSYVFQVHPECNKHGDEGTDSCVSEPISTACTSPPTELTHHSETHNSIQLCWTRPAYGSESVQHYVVSYCAADELMKNPKWETKKTCSPEETEITLRELDTLTKYVFKVRPECKDGEGAECAFSDPIETKATSPPSQPKSVGVTHNSVTLVWDKPVYGSENIVKYRISYYAEEHPDQLTSTECSEEHMQIHGLNANTVYFFKVRPDCENGISMEGPLSEEIKTHPCCQPGELTATTVSHCSIHIQWGKPEFGSVQSYSVVCYQEIDKRKEIARQTIHNPTLSAQFSELNQKTCYVFEVTPECSADAQDIVIESCWSGPISTKAKPLAERMRSISVCIDSGPPKVHKVPVEYVFINERDKIAKCHIGEQPSKPVTEKVLMVVGATGAGKTTLINGMTNYIFNVQWEDQFRFKLVTDENPDKDESHSQTSWITAYTFYPTKGSRIDYTLTIIDTPGFGDCEGIERDKRITNQIREFFSTPSPNDIKEIHGIGFVTQSSLARLTLTQRYIFESILSIFHRDIATNIFLMCTFADGQLPPVLNAVKAAEVPGCDRHFKFNNSALFADNSSADTVGFDRMFWKMGESSFGEFFNDFQAAPHQNLQLTKEVMDERHQLQICVDSLHKQIKVGLSKIDEMQQEELVLKSHLRDIEANKNFIYTVQVAKYRQVKLPAGTYVTNCLECKMTCHARCTIEQDDQKYKCYAMGFFWQKTKDASCRVCPGNCHWTQHVNRGYRYEVYEIFETRTLEDLKTRYEKAVDGKSRAQQMISKNEQDLEVLRTAVIDLLRRTKESLERLNEIALKPNPLTEESYIEILIESEQQAAEAGFEKRIASLKQLKKEVKFLSKAKAVNSREVEGPGEVKTWWQVWKSFR